MSENNRFYTSTLPPILQPKAHTLRPEALCRDAEFNRTRDHGLAGPVLIGQQGGTSKQTRIMFLPDDEYLDRCFLTVGPANTPIVRYSIAGDDLQKFTEAIRQASEELETAYGLASASSQTRSAS